MDIWTEILPIFYRTLSLLGLLFCFNHFKTLPGGQGYRWLSLSRTVFREAELASLQEAVSVRQSVRSHERWSQSFGLPVGFHLLISIINFQWMRTHRWPLGHALFVGNCSNIYYQDSKRRLAEFILIFIRLIKYINKTSRLNKYHF